MKVLIVNKESHEPEQNVTNLKNVVVPKEKLVPVNILTWGCETKFTDIPGFIGDKLGGCMTTFSQTKSLSKIKDNLNSTGNNFIVFDVAHIITQGNTDVINMLIRNISNTDATPIGIIAHDEFWGVEEISSAYYNKLSFLRYALKCMGIRFWVLGITVPYKVIDISANDISDKITDIIKAELISKNTLTYDDFNDIPGVVHTSVMQEKECTYKSRCKYSIRLISNDEYFGIYTLGEVCTDKLPDPVIKCIVL